MSLERKELIVLWDDERNKGVGLEFDYKEHALIVRRNGTEILGLDVYNGDLEVLTWDQNGEVASVTRVDYETGELREVWQGFLYREPCVLSAPEET